MRRGMCVHFNGLLDRHPCCEAGVNYREKFDGEKSGIFLRMPCVVESSSHERINGKLTKVWKVKDNRGETVIPCEKFLLPTPEQIAQAEEKINKYMEHMATVAEAVRPWRTWSKTNKVGKQEVIECPICKGRLHVSQAAYNGHVHGKCETPGCVVWME